MQTVQQFDSKEKNTTRYYIGIDIGGSHFSGGIVSSDSKKIIKYKSISIEKHQNCTDFLIRLQELFKILFKEIEKHDIHKIEAIGVSIPGPFDYENGISEVFGVKKMESLFGLNLKLEIQKITKIEAVYFLNDANSFALGEYFSGAASNSQKAIVVTLGTGFGSSFLINGELQTEAKLGVPPNGYLFNIPFEQDIADSFFSTRWFLKQWNDANDEKLINVEKLASLAKHGNTKALAIFNLFAEKLDNFIAPFIRNFQADTFVIGGGISRAADLFLPKLSEYLGLRGIKTNIEISKNWDQSAILGAVFYAQQELEYKNIKNGNWRKTQQFLLPEQLSDTATETYTIYPSFSVGKNKIKTGFSSLANIILEHKTVVIDGYLGVFWYDFIEKLSAELQERNKTIHCYHIDAALKSETEIQEMLLPYLGGNDPLFGKVTDKNLIDWFDLDKLNHIKPDEATDISIVVGCGAALSNWDAPLIYVDLPKNELQFRARAGCASNLGTKKTFSSKETYKRFFFVDWVVLNRHKSKILSKIDWIVDEQRKETIAIMSGETLRKNLEVMSCNFFRVRPWFEPGAWGGQWMKKNIQQLNPGVANLAWSFELMVLENGLLFESDSNLLEVSFDFLMFQSYKAVLGKDAERFGYDFPIRFDFLDTIEGGNLSVQCHPTNPYIKEHFGMPFTQDETYYILDCQKKATVYLGFQENINKEEFSEALYTSQKEQKPIEVSNYVQSFEAKKHDLFLIPNGTIHASGKGNMVLEISSAPYIFTFKMYDWMQFDLDGKPRPINLERGLENVNFDRKGDGIKTEFISEPSLIHKSVSHNIEHLPTHSLHFYDVFRYNVFTKTEINTNDQCHVWMLVEGTSILVETENGWKQRFYYAETFVIPANAKRYWIKNGDKNKVQILVKAFLKN